MRKSLILSMIMLFFVVTPLWAAVRLVPGEYSTIQGAIEDCNDGDMVIVSPGTYYENINFLGKDITVTGTEPENWDIVAATIIDGNNSGSVVTFANGETNEAILKGFTITGGYGSINSEFGAEIVWGSGIYCNNSSPSITGNIISDNHSPIDMQSGINNYGAGISCLYSNAIISRNIIRNNSGLAGGGIMTYLGAPVITNNVIYDNSASIGGGVALLGGSLINNTIFGNDANLSTENQAGNIYTTNQNGYYQNRIMNNIICNAKSGSGILAYGTWDASNFAYNNVWGNLPGNYSSMTDMTGINGNISNNPLFIDDYHIGTDSPCYSAGDPNYVPYFWQRDIDGQYAVMGSYIEIGADEIIGNARPVADAGKFQRFAELVSDVTLDGTGSYDPDNSGILSYHWRQVEGPNVILSNPNIAEPNFTPTSENDYVFELTVFDGELYSQPDTVTIAIGNRTPIADAGEDQSCELGTQVHLNGTNSYDPDAGDILSYKWTQVSGPSVELSDPNIAVPNLTPSVAGEYVFSLIVNDGITSSLPDTVKIVCRIGSVPDEFGYRWIDSDNPYGPAFHWIDITNSRGKIIDFDSSLEEVLGTLSLGFDFNFYGKKYNKCYIQSSGLISFGSVAINYNNQRIPQADGYDNAVAWLWTLLYPLNDSVIYYKSFGDYFVIQFVDFTLYHNGGLVNAEVILYKSGKIVIQFKDFTGGGYNSSYTIGIENSDGTIGTQVAYNDYDYLHNELAIEFSLGGPYEPIAKAGPDQQQRNLELITLDGTASIDRDPNDILTYQWTQISGPTVVLSDPTAAKPTFTPVSTGEYVFQLTVSDGIYTSVPDKVIVFIGNRTPVANAGKNKSCDPNQVISLDGSGSYDPDMKDVLSYTWTQVSGIQVELSDIHAAIPSFIPTVWGEYVFELVVNDGLEQSLPDTVVVICGMGSAPDDYGYHWFDNRGLWGPKFEWIDIQNTGTRVTGIQNITQGSLGPFSLGFDFNFYGNTYDYFYIQLAGAISFDSTTLPYSNKRIPQADGNNNIIAWMWTLMYPLTNSKLYYQQFDGYTVIQFVDFTAYFNNDANINAEVIIYESGKIKIQYKDISEDNLYQYTIGIENADGTIGTEAAYNNSNFLHDEMVIEFSSDSYLPIAEAGKDQYFSRSTIVTLDGSKSRTYDPSGIKEYRWTQIDGPMVTLSDPNAMQPVFTAESETEYRFELVVSDSIYQSEPDEICITVHDVTPVANPGHDKLIQDKLSVVTLNGKDSCDPLGDSITYTWKQTGGPAVNLSDCNAAEPNFVPMEFGIYEFELIVNDGVHDSDPVKVTIVFNNGFFPIANAGQTVYSDGASVRLDGSRSYDGDGQPEKLIYLWEQISGPSVVITDSNSAKPVISGFTQTNSIQVCEFELVVYDGQYLSFPDTVELKIVPQHRASPLRIESGTFDNNKPTIVFFNGGDGTYGSGSWSYSSDWLAKCNALCFYDYGPDSESSRNYQYHGDILICYLSQIAPNYNKAIQTMGYSTGGQPAIDTAIRMNLTYKDARYAINRVALLDVCCKDYTQDIADFTTKPVDGEQSWVDAYIGTIGAFNPGALSTKTGEDHSTPSLWYKNSLSGADMNKFNGGIISGGYWSVIGPGRNFQLSRSRVNEQIYRYFWNGSQTAGSMSFYNETMYPGRMLGLVNLVDPFGAEDSNGLYLTCLECENAARYQVLVGTDPNRVMDFKVVIDTPEPPQVLITEFPAENCWWTVRASDVYDSNIYADPKPVNLAALSFPVRNLTSKTRYSTIQNAILNAVSGDIIQVEPGVYIENINYLDKNIKIISSDPNDPAVVAGTVIKSANNNPAVTIYGHHDANCLLSGFTITGTNTGVYCGDFSSPVISKCKISGNSLHGISLYSGCVPTITGCDIINNGGCGVIMKITNGRPRYDNYPIITNCVISRNKQYGISEGQPTIINCTIADNTLNGLYNSTAIVTNTIIYFNGNGSLTGQVMGVGSTITYSDVQGTWSGAGNMDSDPLFADSPNGDYHLKSAAGRWNPISMSWVQDSSSSPCIDAGDPAGDTGLEPAPNGSLINLGAYGGTEQASMSQ